VTRTSDAATRLRHGLAGLLVSALGVAIVGVSMRGLLRVTAAQPYVGPPTAILAIAFATTSAILALLSLLRPTVLSGLAPLAVAGVGLLSGLLAIVDLAGLTPVPASPLTGLLGLGLCAAALLFAAPGMRRDRWRTLLRRTPASRIELLFVSAALTIASGGVAALSYQSARTSAVVVPQRPAILDLPAASVLFGAATPEAVAVYFIDLSCDDCRGEFRAMTAALGDPKLGERVQLRFYHYPRATGGCAAKDSPRPQLRLDQPACLAAASVECVELLAPGLGMRMAGKIFDLQHLEDDGISRESITRGAHELGLAIDVEDPQNSLLRCVENNHAVHARVLDHIAFAKLHGVDATPHGFFVGVQEGRLDPERVETFRGALSPTIRARKIRSVTSNAPHNASSPAERDGRRKTP